jgi:demethylmenaquinone methyltransferase/2-methoxy-6-polyprenyl-1,4-benzoquinol methylase
VVATDLFEGYLEIARSKGFGRDNVTLVEADAYSLEGVGGPFDAAFSADWWSHIPRSMVDAFLRALHERLRPGARVVVVDMLRSESHDLAFCRYDAEGNEVQLRTLPTGDSYEVVKNFPKAEELRGRLEYWSNDVEYHEEETLGRWVLRYSLTSR